MNATVRVLPVVKIVSLFSGSWSKIAFDQNGAKSTQAHDPRSSVDCTGGGSPNPAEVVVDVCAIQAIRRNEAVDVQATRFRAGC